MRPNYLFFPQQIILQENLKYFSFIKMLGCCTRSPCPKPGTGPTCWSFSPEPNFQCAREGAALAPSVARGAAGDSFAGFRSQQGPDPRGFVWELQVWCGVSTVACQMIPFCSNSGSALGDLGQVTSPHCIRHLICKTGIPKCNNASK